MHCAWIFSGSAEFNTIVLSLGMFQTQVFALWFEAQQTCTRTYNWSQPSSSPADNTHQDLSMVLSISCATDSCQAIHNNRVIKASSCVSGLEVWILHNPKHIPDVNWNADTHLMPGYPMPSAQQASTMTAKAISKPFPPGYQTPLQISSIISSAMPAQNVNTGLSQQTQRGNHAGNQTSQHTPLEPSSQPLPNKNTFSVARASGSPLAKLEHLLNEAQLPAGSAATMKVTNSSHIWSEQCNKVVLIGAVCAPRADHHV